ncbi:MAG: hypothetical protein ACK463_37145, partial [Bradyrhizobium sp.]
MTIAATACESSPGLFLSRHFSGPLNQNYNGLCQGRHMHSFTKDDFQAGAAATGQDDISGNELRILRDLLQLLPAGVTVQDEQGQFILVNEAAA